MSGLRMQCDLFSLMLHIAFLFRNCNNIVKKNFFLFSARLQDVEIVTKDDDDYGTKTTCIDHRHTTGINFIHYLTASAKYSQPQRELIIADINSCFIQSPRIFSLKMTTMTMFNCMGKHISHCVNSRFTADDHQNTAVLSRGPTYCGMVTLNTGQLYLPKFVHITVHNGFIIQLNILSFDFAWPGFGCESHALSFPATPKSDGVFFCGKRLSWTMVITETEAYIKLSITPYLQLEANIFNSSYLSAWFKRFAQHLYIHPRYLSDTVFQWAPTQQTLHIDPMLDQCWLTVYDVEPTLVQHWVYVSCLLGNHHYLKTETFIYHIITHPMYTLGFADVELNLNRCRIYSGFHFLLAH